MLNIIKSQLYSTVRDIYTYIGGFYMLLMSVMTISLTFANIGNENVTGSLMFSNYCENSIIFSLINVLIFTTRLSGWDFNDKTLNYEVLYGHKRSSVFWSRVFMAVTVSMVTSVILTFAPIVAAYLINGWGCVVPAREALIRSAILVLTLLKFSAVLIFITVIVKNSWTAMILGFLTIMVEAIVSAFDSKIMTWLSVYAVSEATKFENMKLGFIDGEDVLVFHDRLSSSFITQNILICSVTILASLLIGYLIFRKRDMN